jgi:predicted HAD superfamily Cof-like phosphohydrolase
VDDIDVMTALNILHKNAGLTWPEKQVREFMQKAGQETPDKPKMPELAVRLLRVKLIAEELLELAEAYGVQLEITDDSKGQGMPSINVRALEQRERPATLNLVEAYDAYIDLLVVVIGGAVAQGTKLQPGWLEVVKSNLSKFIDGHRREDGKWIRGPAYSPPDLKPIVDAQCI